MQGSMASSLFSLPSLLTTLKAQRQRPAILPCSNFIQPNLTLKFPRHVFRFQSNFLIFTKIINKRSSKCFCLYLLNSFRLTDWGFLIQKERNQDLWFLVWLKIILKRVKDRKDLLALMNQISYVHLFLVCYNHSQLHFELIDEFGNKVTLELTANN